MTDNGSQPIVPEDPTKLATIEHAERAIDVNLILELLRQDLVVLVRNVGAEQADTLVHDVAEKLNLHNALELQAALAGFHGHRYNIGKYFMSVNKRRDYQFITPHSEGNSFGATQLASFFCYENTTDGGETILMNVDGSIEGWQSIRERVMRGRLKIGPLAQHQIVRAKGLYQLNLPDDTLKDDDHILQEQPSKIPGLSVVEVLAKPQKSYSHILERHLNVYWDSIDSADLDTVPQYVCLLEQSGLLKKPACDMDVRQLDPDADTRVWHSKVDYTKLFRCKITRKLVSGDLVIQNNMTWTHAASNWSPNSGIRKIAASFA